MTVPTHASATEIATAIEALAEPRLIVFDCDGVLAPIVSHADDARLAPGVGDSLNTLSTLAGTTVAVLSGRSLAGLAQFDFPDSIHVLGSYGSERRGRPDAALDNDQSTLLAKMGSLADEAVATAGEGAWVERKPASVVVHVRQAEPAVGAIALRRVRDEAERLHGVFVHEGKAVVELAVHRTDKGTAIRDLAGELDPSSIVYFGDDEPDELAFAAIARMDRPSVGVRVGAVPTSAATHQLASSDEVPALLAMLA